MTPLTVLELMIEFAQAFGVLEQDARDWLQVNHPELAAAPVGDREAAINAAEDAKLDAKFGKPPAAG